MSASVSQYLVKINEERRAVSVKSDGFVMTLRDCACSIFGKKNSAYYYLEYNGKILDLLYPLSSYNIPATGALQLRMRENTQTEQTVRVAIQVGEQKPSRSYLNTTTLLSIVNDAISYCGIKIQSGYQPSLLYARTLLTGTDLLYHLIDLGWVDSSIGLRFNQSPVATAPTFASTPQLTIETSTPQPSPDISTENMNITMVSMSSQAMVDIIEDGSEIRFDKFETEVRLLKDKIDDVLFQSAIGFLAKIISNILSDPANEMKRTLNHTGSAFEKKISSLESGMEMLSLLGFTLQNTDKGYRMILSTDRVNLSLLKNVHSFLQNESEVNVEMQPVDQQFDPTKPIINRSLDLPSVTEAQEQRVNELIEKRTLIEASIPERCICVFMVNNGVNPRNFGENAYRNMMKHHDEHPDVVTKEDDEGENEKNDSRLVQEVVLRKKKKMEDNQQFRTKAKRDLEVLEKQQIYRRTTIRVHFPDQTILQAYFAPRETIADVMNVVCSALREEYQFSFYLYNAPPKEILNPTTQLRAARMVPTAMIYLGWESDRPQMNFTKYISPDLIRDAPLYQVDRGTLVEDETVVKEKKKGGLFNKLFKGLKK